MSTSTTTSISINELLKRVKTSPAWQLLSEWNEVVVNNLEGEANDFLEVLKENSDKFQGTKMKVKMGLPDSTKKFFKPPVKVVCFMMPTPEEFGGTDEVLLELVQGTVGNAPATDNNNPVEQQIIFVTKNPNRSSEETVVLNGLNGDKTEIVKAGQKFDIPTLVNNITEKVSAKLEVQHKAEIENIKLEYEKQRIIDDYERKKADLERREMTLDEREEKLSELEKQAQDRVDKVIPDIKEYGGAILNGLNSWLKDTFGKGGLKGTGVNNLSGGTNVSLNENNAAEVVKKGSQMNFSVVGDDKKPEVKEITLNADVKPKMTRQQIMDAINELPDEEFNEAISEIEKTYFVPVDDNKNTGNINNPENTNQENIEDNNTNTTTNEKDS